MLPILSDETVVSIETIHHHHSYDTSIIDHPEKFLGLADPDRGRDFDRILLLQHARLSRRGEKEKPCQVRQEERDAETDDEEEDENDDDEIIDSIDGFISATSAPSTSKPVAPVETTPTTGRPPRPAGMHATEGSMHSIDIK